MNFANAGDSCTPFSGTSLLNCPQIASVSFFPSLPSHIPDTLTAPPREDIKYCQSKGKTVLLSIGGATYTEGGFSSAAAAEAGAQLIWNTFGPANNDALRPFGNAVVDGFDLDFEATVNNMPAFANRLRALYQNGGKQFYLTAAPQCPYPDAANGPMLNGATYFDAIWVQFYNNYCGLQSYVPGSDSQPTFNLATWDEWARSTSLNKNVRVFVGAPANTRAAGSGYVSAGVLGQVVGYGRRFGSFGGVMLWDASQAYANNGFLSAVRSALG